MSVFPSSGTMSTNKTNSHDKTKINKKKKILSSTYGETILHLRNISEKYWSFVHNFIIIYIYCIHIFFFDRRLCNRRNTHSRLVPDTGAIASASESTGVQKPCNIRTRRKWLYWILSVLTISFFFLFIYHF